MSPLNRWTPVSASNIRGILESYVASGGTVIVSSHVMDLVQRMCSHVAVVAGGRCWRLDLWMRFGTAPPWKNGLCNWWAADTGRRGLEWLRTF